MGKFMDIVGDIGKVASSGSSVLGAINGIASLFGSGGTMSQKDIMDWQEKMLDKQLNFQNQQRRQTQMFQSIEADEARKWNSIGEQLHRAQIAGVNPNYLVNSGSYGSAAGSPSPSGAMPSGSGAIPSAPPAQGPEAFNLIAQGLNALSDISVDNAQVDRTRTLLGAELNKLIQEGKVQESIARINGILAEYLPQSEQKRLKKLDEETNLLIKQGKLTDQQVNKVVEEYRQLSLKTGWMQIFDDDFWKSFKDLLLRFKSAQIENIEADTTLKGEQALTEGSVREELGARAKMHRSYQLLNNLAYNIRQSTELKERQANLKRFVAEAKQYGLMTAIMEEQLSQLETAGDWQAIRYIIDGVVSLAGSFASIRGFSPNFGYEQDEWYSDGEKDSHKKTVRRKIRK